MMGEVRLHDPDLDRSAEDGCRLVTLGLLAEACEAAGDLAAGTGEDPLHDFRVAVRRLRSALRSLRPWLAASVRPKDERRLRRAARATGAARDAEVQLAWLAGLRDGGAPAHHAARALLEARLRARAGAGPDPGRLAARFLRDARKLRGRLEWSERRIRTGDGPAPRMRQVLAAAARDELDALSRRAAAIRGPADERAVHRARIQAKRLRYLLEPLQGDRGADASAAVGRLKDLQRLLGDLHDAHVLAAELRDALAEVRGDHARARPGLLALSRAVRQRSDALFAEYRRRWARGGLAALGKEARAVAAALDGGTASVRSSRARPPPPPPP
jgi:CHAD domain-containing protein